jgi:hypothetical protein
VGVPLYLLIHQGLPWHQAFKLILEVGLQHHLDEPLLVVTPLILPASYQDSFLEDHLPYLVGLPYQVEQPFVEQMEVLLVLYSEEFLLFLLLSWPLMAF